MIECRAIIKDVLEARKVVESLGGNFLSNYAFKDIIFVPSVGDFNLTDDFVRVRVYSKTNWPTKNVIVVRKQTKFVEGGKVSDVVLKKEFDTEEEALSFLEKNVSGFEKGFEYSREGWQYELNGLKIFIEDVEGFKPSVEVISKDEKSLEEILSKLNVLERCNESLPELIKKKN